MSGGSYDYAYRHVEDMADSLRAEGSCGAAPAALRELFREHLRHVAEAMHAIEWNDSCDGDSREEELIIRCLSGRLGDDFVDGVLENAERSLAGIKSLRGALRKRAT